MITSPELSDDRHQILLRYILEFCGEGVIASSYEHEELMLEVSIENFLKILVFLKDNSKCLFKSLMDIAGVDYPQRKKRFDVVYNLLSLKYNMRIRLKLCVESEEMVPSVVELYPSANWWEREVWDLYGIPFAGHPDLRRILTDYGFEGHPLRKDFPLTGFVEVRYDEDKKRVVYEPVKLPQDFRTFDFLSPWEGMIDEKINNFYDGSREDA